MSLSDSDEFNSSGFQPNDEDDAPGVNSDIETSEPVLEYSLETGYQVPFTGYALAAPPALSYTLGAAASGQVMLEWATPATSSANIVGYQVSYNVSGSVVPTFVLVNIETLTTTLSLVSGSVYEVAVQAITAEGPGDWSAIAVITAP